jgi:CBS domain-containing protein
MLTEPVDRLALRTPITATPETTVRDALLQMRRGRVGCVIVVDSDRKPLGLFTEVIVRHLLVDHDAPLDACLGEHLRTSFPLVRSTDPIAAVVTQMQANDERFVCVVDESQRVTALTGQKGVMEYIADHFAELVLTQHVGPRWSTQHREGA